MRVALCYPPTRAVTVMPPLGIGYLASAAADLGVQADVYDLARRHIRPRDLPIRLARGDYQVIGISVNTPNYPLALQLVQAIKRQNPRAIIVLGGPHASVFIEESLRDFGADYLFEKEADLSFPLFLRALTRKEEPLGQVPGVYALREGKLCGLPAALSPIDLDQLPWPAWEKMEPHLYPPIPHQLFVRRLPVAPLLTSRGCPYNCSFCATSFLFGQNIRLRRPRSVVDEMRFLRDRFGIREIHFEDDNPTCNRTHAAALHEEIIAANLGILLKYPNGLMLSSLDRELLTLIKRAGCYQISLGIETTSKSAMHHEKKFISYAEIRQTVQLAKEIGLEVQGLFIVGLPYETEEDFHTTVRNAIDMDLDLAHFGVFVPLPGSKQGTIFAAPDIRTINFFTPYMSYPHISPHKLKAMQRWAILKFYLRPRPIRKLLSMFKWRQFFGVLNVFRKYVLGF